MLYLSPQQDILTVHRPSEKFAALLPSEYRTLSGRIVIKVRCQHPVKSSGQRQKLYYECSRSVTVHSGELRISYLVAPRLRRVPMGIVTGTILCPKDHRFVWVIWEEWDEQLSDHSGIEYLSSVVWKINGLENSLNFDFIFRKKFHEL